MPYRRITMQEIADACGVSRNTVSKVFNGHKSVTHATRELVLQKAKELGYGFPAEEAAPSEPAGYIALLTRFLPTQSHFGSRFLTSFTNQISRVGYTLKIYEISSEEIRRKKLPPHFVPEQIAGIVGLEIFDQDYIDMVCRLNIPMVLTDGPADAVMSPISCDYVMMENVAGVIALVDRLAAEGAARIGFVGDIGHCSSFRERWIGYRMGLEKNGLSPDKRFCILEPDSEPYDSAAWLLDRIDRMPHLPDAFVCANDFLAAHLLLALKKRGIAVPREVMITGFDGTSQAEITDPPLTTVQVYGTEIGCMAADVLLHRIRYRFFPLTWTRFRTTPVWRGSIRNAEEPEA